MSLKRFPQKREHSSRIELIRTHSSVAWDQAPRDHRALLLSVTQATRKKIQSSSNRTLTGVEPMTFPTPVGRSTTELQETRGWCAMCNYKMAPEEFLTYHNQWSITFEPLDYKILWEDERSAFRSTIMQGSIPTVTIPPGNHRDKVSPCGPGMGNLAS